MWLDANEGVYVLEKLLMRRSKDGLRGRYREPLAVDDGMEPIIRLM